MKNMHDVINLDIKNKADERSYFPVVHAYL